MRRLSKVRALLVVIAAAPFIVGAHCGMTEYFGPTVNQPIFREGAGKPPGASLVRIRRAAPDYVSAEVELGDTGRAIVRACDDPKSVIAIVEGSARVPIHGNCVEVVLADPEKAFALRVITDIGKTVVAGTNCSPHGDPCQPLSGYPSGATVGQGKEKWTLWSVDVVGGRENP